MTASVTPQTGFGHLTDLPCIKLQFGAASAIISLYGAQLLSYQPQPGKELLWLSPLSDWHNQTPIRGGVPICWPWFGPVDNRLNPQQQKLPNHGVVRTQLWQLSTQSITAEEVMVSLDITVTGLPYYNAATTLQLQLRLSDTLSLSLVCDTPMLQQAALHSYFAVDDISHTSVQPLPQHYQDKVTACNTETDSISATVAAEVDRIYPQPAANLQITTNTMQISLQQAGQDATIVWNPWQEKSRQTRDLADDSYKEFICVETARLQLDQAAALTLTQQLKLV